VRSYIAAIAHGNVAAAGANKEPIMSQSIITKAVAFGFAAMVTLTIATSLDALAQAEQASALATAKGVTQTACVPPARAART